MLLKSTIDALSQIETIISLLKQQEPEAIEYLFINKRISVHIRHVYDHFQALRDGKVSGMVDYNQRSRNSIVETSIIASEVKYKQLLTDLSSSVGDNRPLKVISEIDCFETNNMEVSSNYNRELLYLINHTIHHVAIIKLILEYGGIVVPSFIGLAPGTASHLRQLDECTEVCAQ